MNLAIRRALYGKMAGDTTLTALLGSPASGYSQSIYYEVAPKNAGVPFVVFNKQARTPTYTFQTGTSAFESDLWQIKGVARGTSADPADNIADRLIALLTDGTLTISGRSQMYLRRDSDVSYSEVIDGETYHHSGCLFRLIHQQT